MAKNGPVDPKSKSKSKPKPTRRSARLADSNSRTENANDDDNNDNNNDSKPAAAEPPTVSHRRNSKSPLQVNPVAAESRLQSTTEEQGQKPSNNKCDSGNARRTQKSCRKRKRNTVLKTNQVALSDSDMEMEIDNCDDGHGRAKKKRKSQGTSRSNSAASSLTHGPAWHGWNKQQEIALFNAYFSIKPCTGFWKKIAKMVPGKSSIECFNRFYSVHPTPCSLPRSRISVGKSGSPIKPFASNISNVFSSAMSKRGNYGMSKRKMLSARKLARQMLRQNRGVDKDYETDLFPIVEDYVPAVTSFAPPISPLTPCFQKQTNQNGVHGRSLSHCPPKTLSRFSKYSTYNFKMQCTSPEILKPIKNQHLHDRYIDILHSREIARKKASAEKDISNLPEFNSVVAARAAVVAGAEQILAASQSNAQNDQSDTFTEDSREDDCEDEEF